MPGETPMAEDHVARALSSLRNRDFIGARNAIMAFADTNTLEFQHYLIRGLSDLALLDWPAALATFEEAVELFPHQPQLWFNLGVAQENLGLLGDAAESYEHSLDLKPNQGEACGNLSNVYRRIGLFKQAETMAHRAFELGASKTQALNALGLALARQGRFDGAEKIFRQILQIEPAHAHALANLANCAVDRLDFTSAWPLFAAARAASNDPAIRQEEGMARLLAGDVISGWTLYEARLERPGFLRVKPAMPMWRGEPLAGKKLLLVAEQGFGDAIQFCRYGIALARDGADITWLVPAPLQRLFAESLPGRVVAEGDDVPPADAWAPLMSLPLLTYKTDSAAAPPAPYLRAPQISNGGPDLPGVKKGKRKIGLVWAGSPTHERAHERSMHLAQFSRLVSEIPARWYAPFAGFGIEEAQDTPVTRLDPLIKDFADTAALLAQLDLLITVDTAVAHLAGALGVTTWLLLPHCPDWRWGISGANTPWYPAMKLFRQPSYGDWESVIGQVIGALKV